MSSMSASVTRIATLEQEAPNCESRIAIMSTSIDLKTRNPRLIATLLSFQIESKCSEGASDLKFLPSNHFQQILLLNRKRS